MGNRLLRISLAALIVPFRMKVTRGESEGIINLDLVIYSNFITDGRIR
jgi:hypothetical protein